MANVGRSGVDRTSRAQLTGIRSTSYCSHLSTTHAVSHTLTDNITTTRASSSVYVSDCNASSGAGSMQRSGVSLSVRLSVCPVDSSRLSIHICVERSSEHSSRLTTDCSPAAAVELAPDIDRYLQAPELRLRIASC